MEEHGWWGWGIRILPQEPFGVSPQSIEGTRPLLSGEGQGHGGWPLKGGASAGLDLAALLVDGYAHELAARRRPFLRRRIQAENWARLIEASLLTEIQVHSRAIGQAGEPLERSMASKFGRGLTAPDYRIYSTDGRWVVENEGVTPDIEVDLDPAEVARGHDAQLTKAIEVLLEKIEEDPRPWPTHPPFKVDR